MVMYNLIKFYTGNCKLCVVLSQEIVVSNGVGVSLYTCIRVLFMMMNLFLHTYYIALTSICMYIIINKSKKTTIKYEGDWPDLDEELNAGDKIIVISLYSNTIKVPYYTELNGIVEWRWDDYPFDPKSL